jgi:molybdenum ABC transporter molybdate-binding protein
MRWGINAFLGSAAVLACLIALLWNSRPDPDRSSLFVYCAAGLKRPIEEIAREFEREEGVKIQLSYGGSGDQLAAAKGSKVGDLYIPADYKYIEQARQQDLIDEEIPLASMHAVVAVRKGNPKNIHTFDDLLRKDVEVVLANDAAAIGELTHRALQRIQRWEPLKKKSVFKGTEPMVSTDVRLGTAHAGILWDSTVSQFSDKLEGITISELKSVTGGVTLSVLRSSEHPASALRFARYLSSREKGMPIFEKYGFVPVADADLWEDDNPTINLLVGAMLKPAVEETIRSFEQREGLAPGTITINYNGCGVLVSQMKAGERPDAFFACDAKYFDEPLEKEDPDGKKVKDLFLNQNNISTNRLVLLVHKGNPKHIKSLRDLTRKGMRIGVGDEHKCAMGALTDETFRQGGIRGKVNIAIKVGTGAQLVAQMQAAPNEMDAAVVYISNAKHVRDKFDVVEIDLECAVAAQPIAAGEQSSHKYLVGRLINAIKSSESRKRFEANDFTWKATR